LPAQLQQDIHYLVNKIQRTANLQKTEERLPIPYSTEEARAIPYREDLKRTRASLIDAQREINDGVIKVTEQLDDKQDKQLQLRMLLYKLADAATRFREHSIYDN
jgi:hypothetical protein